MAKKILVIAVHPDDETLGCGGTLLKHRKDGDEIFWLIITNAHEEDGWSNETVIKRADEIVAVGYRYNFKETFNLEFPTTKLDILPIVDIIKRISEVFFKVRPQIIYTINRSDIHSDHRIAFQAIISCAKNFRCPFVERILMYESLSETEYSPALIEAAFLPNVFIDITDFMVEKLQIMSLYTSEVMPDNLPRSCNSVKALAAYRGSRIGVNYAEAFMLLFEKL